MKRFWTTFVLVFILGLQLGFTQRMQRQMPPSRKPTIDQRVRNLNTVLNLNPIQQKAVRKIFEDAQIRMKKIVQENRGNRQAIRAASKDQRELTIKQIMNILSETQKVKYQKYLKEAPARQSSERFHRRGQRRNNF